MRSCIISIALLVVALASKANSNLPADSTVIRTTLIDFYRWYTVNYEKFQPFELYTGIKTKDQPPYKINWNGVEKYFTYIRASVPQLGEEFISGLRQHFRQADSAFKVDVSDEIPYGFDYDWFTNSQEDPQWLLDELSKASRWTFVVTGNDADVTVYSINNYTGKNEEAVLMCFKMKREKSTWKIAHIGCPYE